MLSHRNKKCRSGPNGLPNKIINNCLNGVSKSLYILFNKIVELNKIPDLIKISEIIPLLKPKKISHYLNPTEV